jgi:gliding motility-associated lipoprotein GldH
MITFWKGLYFSILITLCGIATSCQKDRVYEQYLSVNQNIWTDKDAKTFSLEISDTTQLYNLFLEVRNNNDYLYNNLWLGMQVVSPEGKIQTKEFSVKLADEQGNWLGSGMGNLFDNQFMIAQNIHFPKKGNYTIKMEHIMRESKLEGILSIGIKLQKVNNNH